jgi:hypothetical protein
MEQISPSGASSHSISQEVPRVFETRNFVTAAPDPNFSEPHVCPPALISSLFTICLHIVLPHIHRPSK